MTPERFQQVEELYHAVCEKTAGERDALLAHADPELRCEVESLLRQRPGGEFFDRPGIGNSPSLPPSDESDHTQSALSAHMGPYRLGNRLGAGGMGEVYRAVDTRLGREVAIKVARQEFSDRFEREARVLASFNHPHICALYDVGPNYLVMELVEGKTLADHLKTGPLPLKTALLYASQILAGLVEAHSRGILHRDIKPGNIMIGKSGAKLLDFGLAKSGQDETVTVANVVLGTPIYMAPEQREGKPADARSDIYSFGCVLHEMVTGARVTSQRKHIPSRQLERIVTRCLEENPERRWQSAVDLEREIGLVAGGPSRWTILSAAAVVLTLFAGVAYFYLNRTPKLTDKDVIVLADFVNDTGDPIFDGTLRQGLASQFEQSPFLKTMDDEQMRRVLRLMSLKTDTRVTNQVAREICVREGAAATIDGTIASLGKSYVLTLQAVACQDGATLAREQIQAIDKEHVLNALGTAATGMRGKLGESHNSIQSLNRPLEQATTGSLEALQTYTAAFNEMRQGRYPATIPLWERATEIDPNFAMAYYYLGVAFDQAGDMARTREYAVRAFRLVDRVSEHERTAITGFYYLAHSEWDKAIDVYQLGVRNYPRFWGFHNQLAVMYIDLGRYEDALKEGVEAARLATDAEPPYRRQLDAYICLNRLPEAKQLADRLRANGLDGVRIHQRFLEIAYIEDDQGAISKEMQWFAGKPSEYISLGLQAAYHNVHGQRRESQRLFRRAAETALRQGLRNAASEFDEADARADALAGNCQSVRRLGRPALALAMCGDAARAERLAADSSKLFPNGTLWNAVQLPAIRATVELNRDQPAKSVEFLISALPYERANLEAIYLRGLAYLSLKKGAEAAAEFHKILDHKGANWASAWRYPYWGQFYSLSHLGLARSAALTEDTVAAKKAYRDLFALWKDADPDLPVLQQAKVEYAKLP
ncbi:MAG: serine/threonine-protein kinase [Acidobacteriota bacterium]